MTFYSPWCNTVLEKLLWGIRDWAEVYPRKSARIMLDLEGRHPVYRSPWGPAITLPKNHSNKGHGCDVSTKIIHSSTNSTGVCCAHPAEIFSWHIPRLQIPGEGGFSAQTMSSAQTVHHLLVGRGECGHSSKSSHSPFLQTDLHNGQKFGSYWDKVFVKNKRTKLRGFWKQWRHCLVEICTIKCLPVGTKGWLGSIIWDSI